MTEKDSKPTVIILGASGDRRKFGNKSVRAHQRAGYDVLPVNPRGGEIEGLAVFGSLSELADRTVDRISVYLPPAVGLSLIDEIAQIDCREVWLNPGTESDELVARAEQLQVPIVKGCSIVDVGFSPSDFPD